MPFRPAAEGIQGPALDFLSLNGCFQNEVSHVPWLLEHAQFSLSCFAPALPRGRTFLRGTHAIPPEQKRFLYTSIQYLSGGSGAMNHTPFSLA